MKIQESLITPIRSAVAALAISALTIGCATAKENVEFKTIKIDAEDEITIAVDEDGDKNVFMFDMSALDDLSVLDERLIDMPEDTRLRIREALEKLKASDIERKLSGMIPELERKFIVLEREMNNADLSEALESLESFEDKKIDIVKIFNQNSAERISRSIEKGEFTREQLDQIQAALDAKR